MYAKLAEQGLGHKQISEQLQISDAFVVGIIYRGEWNHISSQYNMPKPKQFADKEVVHEICKRLEKGIKLTEISAELNVDYTLCSTINQGKAWRQISNQYNIPGLEKVEVKDKLSDKIRALLEQGITETDDIIRRLNLPNNTGTKKYIQKVRRVERRKSA